MKKRITNLFIIMAMLISFIPTWGVQAVTANTIKIGDYVQMGKYYDEPILWRCVDIDENGPLMLSDKIITIKPFDASGNHTYLDGTPQADTDRGLRTINGSSLWSTSNMRSWLNSTEIAGKVKWLDGCPPTKETVNNSNNYYNDEKGFLAEGNFTVSEQTAIKSVKQKSILNDIDVKLREGGTTTYQYSQDTELALNTYDTAYYQMVEDKMFLLDIKQLNKVYKNGTTLGTEYWIGKLTQKAVDKSSYNYNYMTAGGNWNSWTRSPYGDSSYPIYINYLGSNNAIDKNNANGDDIGVRPAFYISSTPEIFKSGNGSIETPYVVNSGSGSIDTANVITPKSDVAKNKIWNIKFNLSVKPSEINSSNIYVLDKNGKVFTTTVNQDTTNNKIICIKPVTDYIVGESYTIWIKELKSIDGKVLKKNVKMEFTIAK